jgi:hypothetical protein
MSKLPTRFVIAFLAIGILVGAATTAIVISADLKSSNRALAQLRSPTRIVTSLLVSITPGTIRTATAICPASSDTITGGGFNVNGHNVNVVQSFPDSTRGWRVVVQNTSPFAFTFHAYAVCSTVSP